MNAALRLLAALRLGWQLGAWKAGALAIGLVCGATVSALRGPLEGGRLAVVAALVLVALLLLQTGEMLRVQNRATLARLVPGQAQTLLQGTRCLLLLAWGLALVASVLVMSEPVLLLPLLLAASLAAGLGLSFQRWGLMALSLALLGLCVLGLQLGGKGAQWGWSGLLASSAIALAALWQAARWLPRPGDPRHRRLDARHQSQAAILRIATEGGRLTGLRDNGLLARFMLAMYGPLRAHITRRSRRPVQHAGDALARARLVVHPSFHWRMQLWSLLVVGLPFLLALLAPLLLIRAGWLEHAVRLPWWDFGLQLQGRLDEPGGLRIQFTPLLLLAPLAVLAWLYLAALNSVLTDAWATRPEQALLRLLPQLAQGQALALQNRSALLRDSLLGWLLHLLPLLACYAFIAPARLPGVASAMLLTLLPLAALLRSDPARQRLPRGSTLALTALGALGVALWPVLTDAVGGWLLLPPLLVLPLLAWALHHKPPAQAPWPAGRLAER